MKNTLKIKVVNHKRSCIICGQSFNLSSNEVMMIEAGIIHPLDINICNDCADREAEAAEMEMACSDEFENLL